MNCIFSNSDCNGDLKHRMPLAATESSAAMCEYHWALRQHDVRVAASTGCTCWEGYERVPGTKPCAPGSCRKKNKKSAGEYMAFCPACGKRQAECEGHGNDAFRSLILQKHREGNHSYCIDSTSCRQASKESALDVWKAIDLMQIPDAALGIGALYHILKTRQHKKQINEKLDAIQEHLKGQSDQTEPKEAAVKDEPGFLEEEESFKGRKDDDEDTPKSEFDELPTLEQRIQSDMRDNEDDINPKDKEDMTEFGRNASVKCAACGENDCLGHEENSINHMILVAHASEDHSSCHPKGCSSVGRSFHAHVCSNCGGESPCMGTRTASICDTFDGFCKTCFVNLAGVRTALDNKELNQHMRMRNVKHQPPVTQAVVDRAMGQGHSLETAMEEVGQHRPAEKDAAKESGDSFVPPQSVANAAKKGLELRKKYHRGGTEIGVARARDLSNRKGLSLSTVKRMKAYFDRHEVDKKGEGWGTDSAGYIAWLLWGGDSGRSWANKIVKQHEKKSWKFASNECGTCGHGWSNHGKNASCPCCADFKEPKKASTELPEWLKEAMKIIAEDAQVIDLEAFRRGEGVKAPETMNEVRKKFEWTNVTPQAPKTVRPELYDQDAEVNVYDQDREEFPIPNTDSDKTTLREQFEAIGDWLGLTDDPKKPYNRKTDPKQYE